MPGKSEVTSGKKNHQHNRYIAKNAYFEEMCLVYYGINTIYAEKITREGWIQIYNLHSCFCLDACDLKNWFFYSMLLICNKEHVF